MRCSIFEFVDGISKHAHESLGIKKSHSYASNIITHEYSIHHLIQSSSRMRVIFLALVGMSVIIKVATGEELETQCTGDNKLHCCKQIQNGESTAEEVCASFDCSLDIECDDSDGDSWDEYYREERDLGYKPSGGWNSKVSMYTVLIVALKVK